MNKKIMPFLNIKKINFNILKIIIIFIFFTLLNFSISSIYTKTKNIIRKNRIGVISVWNEQNVGNMLVKFSMYTKLKEFGLDPVIICNTREKTNIDFLKRYVKFKEIKKNFSELNKNDYDILMVNSDQTWSAQFRYLLNIGFLYFARNWSIVKFTYGTSLGSDSWNVPASFLSKAIKLVKNFKSISVREQNAIKIIQHYLGVKPVFVLDPTFLINTNNYFSLIQDFKLNINMNNNYLCVYQLDKNEFIENFINEVSIKYNLKILFVDRFKPNYIENFIFSYNISKAIITDSYHGTVFSIIFNKPFISFINSKRGRDRFFSLAETFKLKNRIVFPMKSENIDMDLLIKKPLINQTEFAQLKEKSLNYLKKNLDIFI